MAIDRKYRAQFKHMPCLACGNIPSDPCHVRSYKVSQCDEDWNIIPFCRTHHMEQHRRGWRYMLTRYENLAKILTEMGWGWDTFHKKFSMYNPKEVEFQQETI